MKQKMVILAMMLFASFILTSVPNGNIKAASGDGPVTEIYCNKSDLQHGDIFITQGDMSWHPFFAALAQTDWTHAGCYDKYNDKVLQMAKVDEIGIQHTPWNDFWDQNNKIYVLRVKSAYASTTEKQQVVNWLISRVSEDHPYDWASMFAFTKQVGPTGFSGSKYYCTELVWAAYMAKAGIDLDITYQYPWGTVDPIDFHLTTKTFDVGYLKGSP